MIGLFLIKEVLEDKNNKNVGSMLNNVGQTMFFNHSEEELKAKRLRNLRLKEERRERIEATLNAKAIQDDLDKKAKEHENLSNAIIEQSQEDLKNKEESKELDLNDAKKELKEELNLISSFVDKIKNR
jgi:hypothetical protein